MRIKGQKQARFGSFFPQHWTQREVLLIILEAFNKKEKFQEKDISTVHKNEYERYRAIVGNIPIIMLIDNKGQVQTAYPYVDEKVRKN